MTGATETRHRSTGSLLRSTLVVGSVRAVDFGLSFLVSALLAGRFGATGQLDAFFLARRTTVGFADTIRKLVSQVLMPSLVARTDSEQPLSIHGLPRRVYGFLGIFAALTLAGTFIPSLLVSLFAPGFTGMRHELTATMMAIMMPLLPIAVVASLLVATLQANGRFLLSEGTNVIQRLVLVLVLAFAVPPLGIVAGAWTMLASGVIGTAILFAGAWPLVRRRPAAMLRETEAGTPPTAPIEAEDVASDAPTALRAGVGGGVAAAIVLNLYFQASSLLDFAVASTVAEGGVAALEYGARLVSLVPGLVMSSLSIVLLPELVRAMQDADRVRGAAALARFQRIGVFVQIPVSIGMMLGAELMVRVLFGYGAFSEANVLTAAGTTGGYAAAAIFLAPASAITSAIYADPWRPCLRDVTVIAVGGLALRAVALAIGAPVGGAVGIAWAAAAATLATAALAQGVAMRRFPDFGIGGQLVDFAQSALCGLVAAAGGYALLTLLPDVTSAVARVATLAALGSVVVALYAGAAIVLRVPEMATAREIAVRIVRRKLGRA